MDLEDLERPTNTKSKLGPHPSGDIEVRDNDRVAELSIAIERLSPQKPGASIFSMLDCRDNEPSPDRSPETSPKLGEDVFEAMGDLENMYLIPTTEDSPGLIRAGPPIDFATAHEWKLGGVDEAALNYESHRIHDPEEVLLDESANDLI